MNIVKLPRTNISRSPEDILRQIKIRASDGDICEDDKPLRGGYADSVLKEFSAEQSWLKDNKIKAEFLCYDTYILVQFNNVFDATAFKLRF